MSSPRPVPDPSGAPPLRVYAHTDQGDGLSPSMSLSDFFHVYVVRVLQSRGAAPRNLEQYDETLGLWVRYTGDPPLQEITSPVVQCFKVAISGRPGRNGNGKVSPNTVRKHLIVLQTLFDLAGPKVIGLMGPGRRTNEQRARRDGLLGVDADGRPRPAPYVDKPPPRHKPVTDVFTIEEIEQWLEACQSARFPRGIPGISAPRFWTALVLWNYFVGTRIGTTLALRWSMLVKPTLIRVPADSLKGTNDQEFYIHPMALAAAAAIRTRDPRIFPWPCKLNYLERLRRELLAAAGIPKERRFGFHGGRKCLCTQLMQINPIAAQKALGHLGIAMTRDHYTGADVVAAAMAKIPQPRLPGGQLELF